MFTTYKTNRLRAAEQARTQTTAPVTTYARNRARLAEKK